MGDFLNNLYNNDSFILYLGIAIGILVVLFIIVYFCGKKDEKLEKTKQLKIEKSDAFKEVNKEITDDNKLEVEEITKEPEIVGKEQVEKSTTQMEHSPLIVEDETEILPVINKEDMQKNEVTTTVFEPINEHEIDEVPVDEINEENNGEFYNSKMEETANNLEKELSDLAKMKDEFNKISANSNEEHKEIINDSNQQVFSSVFIGNKPKSEISDDDFELPTLKANSDGQTQR